MDFGYILIVMLFLHALADFALQSDAMAKGKNRHIKGSAPPGQKLMPCWYWWLSAHALIQGGLIIVTFGVWWLGLIEIISHFIIDFLKCDNVTNPNQDQACHLSLRIIYAIVLVFLIG